MPGARFMAREPKAPKANPFFAAISGERTEPESPARGGLRGGLVGLTLGSALVITPFVMGTARTAKVFAPIATLPVAVSYMAVGVYAGVTDATLSLQDTDKFGLKNVEQRPGK